MDIITTASGFESNIALINASDARAFVKACNIGEPYRDTALYWSGIITQAEYFTAQGVKTDEEIDTAIRNLKVATAEWLLS